MKGFITQTIRCLAYAFIFMLWLYSSAYADKYCPVDGEVYADKARFCGTHGNKLETKKPASSKTGSAKVTATTPQTKAEDAADTTKIHLYHSGGKKEAFGFRGLNADCEGYRRDGLIHSESGSNAVILWREISFILPEYGRAKLKNGKLIESPTLRRSSCPEVRIQGVTKRKVMIVGYEGEKEEALEIQLSRIEIVSFDQRGLEEGLSAREELALIQGERERIAAEEKRRQEADAAKIAEAKKRQADEEIKRRVETETARKFYEKIVGEMVFVKGGCFRMGDSFGERRPDELPLHEVCVNDFYIGKYEVTQGQWKALMGGNPSENRGGDSYPVEKVSWNDAQEFIRKLNEKTGMTYRLPTEAEWEYAATSGGKQEKYSGGSDVDAVSWYQTTSGGKSHPVGTKAPNGLEIHDMSGNVWEWVQDLYDGNYYDKSPPDNPQGSSSGTNRVARGGSWYDNARFCRATNRHYYPPERRDDFLGFRLTRIP